MKKSIKRLVITLLIIIFILLATYLMFFNTTYVKFLDISNDPVDNSYNNNISNMGTDLIRIDDKLYFNYLNGNCLKYGTYEISNGITKRVYWEGIKPYPSTIDLDCVYDGKILNMCEGNILRFDVDSGEYVEDTTVKTSEQFADYNCFVKNNKLYYLSDDNLYTYQDEKSVLISSSEKLKISDFSFSSNCYINGKYIYYQNRIDNEIYICRYDTEQQKIADEICIKNVPDTENGVNNLLADGDDVYFLVDFNKLYHLDFKAEKTEKLFETNGVITANYFQWKLFVGVEKDNDKNGLYIIDMKNNTNPQKICDKESSDVYILDEKWIYFSDSSECLYRITSDGKTLEKVFGL